MTLATKAAADRMKERNLHVVVADIIRLYRRSDAIVFHVPNEGKRAVRQGAFLKRMLMLPGAPDFSVTTAGGKQHWLELKTVKGRVSPEQASFAQQAHANGSDYVIARSPEEAASILFAWGALTENPLAHRQPAQVAA